MKFLSPFLLPCAVILLFTNCTAQIPNAKSTSVKIYGNCGMCEKTIEKAAYVKGEVKAEWDQDSKMAVITFDSTKTGMDAVLQRIAAGGYDSDQFKAPAEAYSSLAECCQYERPPKAEPPTGARSTPENNDSLTQKVAVVSTGMVKKQTVAAAAHPLAAVYTAYFSLKDALVATDGRAAAAQAKTLSTAISQVNMESLTPAQHSIWLSYQSKLSDDAGRIQGLTDAGKQRERFSPLSKNMYALMKAIKPATPVYYEFCPMYGDGKSGNWLSMEPAINNPYFGDKMLHCGSVTETLK